MHLLDPYGLGASTPTPPASDPEQPLPVPERQEEVDLAQGSPPEEQQPLSESIAISGLDPALRMQDGVGTWPDAGDTTADEVGSADFPDGAEPDAEPFAPLTDSGGQGL